MMNNAVTLYTSTLLNELHVKGYAPLTCGGALAMPETYYAVFTGESNCCQFKVPATFSAISNSVTLSK